MCPSATGDEKDASLCEHPVWVRPGRAVPKCLAMIDERDVIRAVERYLEFDAHLQGPAPAALPAHCEIEATEAAADANRLPP